jgi:hypothetical protein
MLKVEQSVQEYEEYLESVGEIEYSDRMKSYIETYMQGAFTDHFMAFQQTYQIYEQDRNLTHEAYDFLPGHFEFARLHWPDRAMEYRQIYKYHEDRWERFWTD